MSGPEGRYELACSPLADDPWEGWIEVEIAGVQMKWSIERVDDDGNGLELGGITTGSAEVWGDAFWYALWPASNPPRIDYFGDRVLWRSDLGEAPRPDTS